ncbi:MAG: 30S ribosomal protein S2 [bacterium]|nr:30S ribosomal protein S2 [bacterium]
MREITLKELLEAGCHFGHQVPKSNPKAREFVYTSRDKIQIIDLAKTKEGLEKAAAFVKTVASQGGKIIFVGTKKQARSIVIEEARRAGVFYMAKRWIGGLLTNWEEVGKNLKRMEQLRENLKSEEWTKKEKVLMEKKLRKLELMYGGIEGMTGRPYLLYIVDTHREESVIKEAARTNIPVIGIVDTNADPGQVDWSIPANDDAVKSIQLITSYIADAVIEGKEMGKKQEEKEEKAQKVDEPETKDAKVVKKTKKSEVGKDTKKSGVKGNSKVQRKTQK